MTSGVGCHKWLKLNDYKAEIIYLGSKQQLSKCDQSAIRVSDKNIKCMSAVWNSGVISDNELKFKDHVAKVCRIGYFQLRISDLWILKKQLL